MDSAYGTDASLRRGTRELGLDYSAAVYARTLIEGSKGKMTAEALAVRLPKQAWRTITWREGSAEPLRSRFARVRVRARGEGCRPDEPEEWLLIEWPKGEPTPTKYWLSTLSRNIAFDRFVDITMMRWRIERDYQDLKQEVGLGHFEGRGWRGFHHHATMCIAAYGFLISRGAPFPPRKRAAIASSRNLPFPRVGDPEAPPLRPERHVANSIASMRRQLIAGIARALPRCPCCAMPRTRGKRR